MGCLLNNLKKRGKVKIRNNDKDRFSANVKHGVERLILELIRLIRNKLMWRGLFRLK